MDKLSQEDAKLFYSIWLPLLDFVNQKYSLLPSLLPPHPGFEAMSGKNAIEPKDAYAVSSVLWENSEKEIDDYLDKHQLPEAQTEAQREILNSWKRKITSRFFMVRHLRDEGTILIQAQADHPQTDDGLNSASSVNRLLGDAGSGEGGRVFLVRGIESNIEAMFPPEYFPLPLLVRTTLIPFKDVIITDGLIQRYEFYMGKGIKKILNDAYMQAKWDRKVISRF